MRILVLSDTHGDFNSCQRALDAQTNADAIIHCGDGKAELQYIKDHYTDIPVIGVCGNCDFHTKQQPVEVVELGGKRFFVTHGHLYQAKYTLSNLVYAAREQKADVLLFGHTHQAMTDYDEGLHIMNPGSCAGYFASYGIVEITPKGEIITNIVKLNTR